MPNLRITSTGSFSFTQAGVYALGGNNEASETVAGLLQYTSGGVPIDAWGPSSWPTRLKPFTGRFLLTGTPQEVNTLLEALEAEKARMRTVTGEAGATVRTIDARLLNIYQEWSVPRRNGTEQWLYITCTWQPVDGDWT